MPGSPPQLDQSHLIAEMRAEMRRLRAFAISQMPQPAKDTLTITSNGNPATWQLTGIPLQGSGTGWSSVNLSLNGDELLEGTDYTVDYTTAIVTFSAGQQALFKATPTPADVLTADYWTTGDLIAAAMPADTGGDAPTSLSFRAASGNSTGPSVTMPATFASGDLLIAALGLNLGGATVTVEPTGWTLVSSTPFLRVYKKVSTGSETSVAWTISGAQGWNVEVRSFRGALGTPSVDSSGTGTQHLGSSAPAPVLTSGGSRLELGYWAVQKTFIVNAVSAPGGWVNADWIVNASTGGLMVAEKAVTAGATSADNATSTGEDDWNIVALLLSVPA